MSLWFKVQLWSLIWRDCPEEFMWGYKTLYDLKLLLQSRSTKTIVFLVLRPLVSSLIEWKTHGSSQGHIDQHVCDKGLTVTQRFVVPYTVSDWTDSCWLLITHTHTHTQGKEVKDQLCAELPALCLWSLLQALSPGLRAHLWLVSFWDHTQIKQHFFSGPLFSCFYCENHGE